MANLLIEAQSTAHGFERFNLKIIKKYNVSPEEITPKFRTRPAYGISGVVIGRNISYEDGRDYLLERLKASYEAEGCIILNTKLLK